MQILVGHTGFVGSNLTMYKKFNGLYNSQNISEAFGSNPDLLVYSGVKAEKYLANRNPRDDFNHVKEAVQNIKKIDPKRIVLISTVDVYNKTFDVTENSYIDSKELKPYGKNRYYLECWVREHTQDYHIIRLPALYGKNIKKNFIYDLINQIPSMLPQEKFQILLKEFPLIAKYYDNQHNSFYKCRPLSAEEHVFLKKYFQKSCLSSLYFTDQRAIFQFYNLSWLWTDIQTVLNNNIKTLNLVTEPISANEIYEIITGDRFINELSLPVPYYNIKTLHGALFQNNNHYINNKTNILSDILSYYNESLRS